MLGDKAESMIFQNTSKPIDSGKYRLPAIDIHIGGNGKLFGLDVKSRAAFNSNMRPDAS